MIEAIFILLAAIFKAIADTLAHHFYSSVFRRFENSPFWNPLHKRNDAVKRIFDYPIDAWHLANSGMIFCFIASLYPVIGWKFVLFGIGFNIVFSLFYNKILR